METGIIFDIVSNLGLAGAFIYFYHIERSRNTTLSDRLYNLEREVRDTLVSLVKEVTTSTDKLSNVIKENSDTIKVNTDVIRQIEQQEERRADYTHDALQEIKDIIK